MKSAFALAILLALALPAAAQVPAPKPQAAPDTQTFGDWRVHCIAGALPPCEMFQLTQNKDGKRLSSFALAYLPRRDSYAIQVSVPLGAAFAKGVKLIASEYSSQAMPYLRCDGAGCYVQGAIERGALDRLGDSTQQAKLTIGDMSGRDIAIPLSLRGFTDARTAMEHLAREKIDAAANKAAPAKPAPAPLRP